MEDLKITTIQTKLHWMDIDANLAMFTEKIDQIDDPGDVIVLPEMFSTGFAVKPDSVAETMEGKALQWLKDTAAKKQCVITGSVVIEENENYYNRLVWMQPDGFYETYDKRHLFRLGDEHLRFSQGRKQLLVELKGWKIKPLVCYDLRFPVWAKNRYIADQYEYDVLIYIANWPGRRRFAWTSLLRARAIENQSYLVGVNRVGDDGNGIPHTGDSVFLDAKGKPVYEFGEEKEHIETVTLNYEKLREYRQKFTVGLDWDGFELQL
ncbi:MAG: amidohydrolase [Bacteroidales bacterium]|nr:amidohydrolase [Bacteroidales bacterium]